MNEEPRPSAIASPAADMDAWIRLHAGKVRRILPWLQIATGAVLVAVAWHIGKTPITLMASGSRTTGEIVRFDYETSGPIYQRAYSALHPVVEFAAGSQRVQFRDRWGSRSSGGVHDRVPVLFDSREPSVALIDRPLLNWMPWAPILVVGLFLVLVGGLAKVRGKGA